MKTIKYLSYIVLATLVLCFASCEPKELKVEDVFVQESQIEEILKAENPDGNYKVFHLNDFLDSCMTEKGNFASDTCPYRTRSTNDNKIFLYSVDTIPEAGRGIYIRGRVTTDDYAGNFYKSMVIQEVVDGEQQNLRISVDMGSSGGMFQLGQEILIRCNGLAVGRYANQPQLCVPSYNNNIFAMNASQKVGWAPGRIPSARFRRAVHMIGVPDQTKLQYDKLSLVQLFGSNTVQAQVPLVPKVNETDMKKVRYADGRLVIITGVHFTGEANEEGSRETCIYAHPDTANNANVFAPTTNNIGYPQTRILENKGKADNGTLKNIGCSCSEYCKFAYFLIPGAQQDKDKAIKFCKAYEGTVTGILGWYCDNATGTKAGTLGNLTGNEWSVTPRGIPGIGIPDIQMADEDGNTWIPEEFDPANLYK